MFRSINTKYFENGAALIFIYISQVCFIVLWMGPEIGKLGVAPFFG